MFHICPFRVRHILICSNFELAARQRRGSVLPAFRRGHSASCPKGGVFGHTVIARVGSNMIRFPLTLLPDNTMEQMVVAQ